jgi:hypothetical protein
MHKCIKIHPFMQQLFDDPTTADKAAEIGQAILAARSLRLGDPAGIERPWAWKTEYVTGLCHRPADQRRLAGSPVWGTDPGT